MNLLKRLYWDLSSKDSRAIYVESFLRGIPSTFGNLVREKWYRRRFKKRGDNLTVPYGAHIINPQNIECGNDVSLGLYCFIQAGGGLILGSDVVIGPYAKIWTQNHQFQDPDLPIRKQGNDYKSVKIGDDVWIGANAFIMPGVELGDKCVVSAHAVVGAKSYPPGTILAGHPARKVGERN